MESLKNYLLVCCRCISINTKKEEESALAYIYYLLFGFFLMKFL